jgi:hypothetical protein
MVEREKSTNMINLLKTGLRSSAARFGAFICVATALLAITAPRASAALLTTTQGSATTTITSLVFNADSTLSIESVQSGYLSNIGAFTARFSYTAFPTPTTIVLVGTGTLITATGDRLFLQASIVEMGLDYPRTLNGALTITGGTGRFVGAKGTLLVSGIDEESLTDTIQIQGAILTPGSLFGGLSK